MEFGFGTCTEFTDSTAKAIDNHVRAGKIKNMTQLKEFIFKLMCKAFGTLDTCGWICNVLENRDEATHRGFYTLFHPSSCLFQLLLSHAHVADFVQIPLSDLPHQFQTKIQAGKVSELGGFFQSRLEFPQFDSTEGIFKTLVQSAVKENAVYLKLSLIETYFFRMINSWILVQESSRDIDPQLYLEIIESYLYYLFPLVKSFHFSGLDSRLVAGPYHSLKESIFTSSSIRLVGSIDGRNVLAGNLSDAFISLICELWINSNTSIPKPSTIMLVHCVVRHSAVVGLFEELDPIIHLSKRKSSLLGNLKTGLCLALKRPLFYMIDRAFRASDYTLDWKASFALVDTWMAYLQPWRIRNKLVFKLTGDISMEDFGSPETVKFVCENFLFYTQLLAAYLDFCLVHSNSLFFSDSIESSLARRQMFKVLLIFQGPLLELLKEQETFMQQFVPKSLTCTVQTSFLSSEHGSMLKSGAIELVGSMDKARFLFDSDSQVRELVAKIYSATLTLAQKPFPSPWTTILQGLEIFWSRCLSHQYLLNDEKCLRELQTLNDMILRLFGLSMEDIALNGILVCPVGAPDTRAPVYVKSTDLVLSAQSKEEVKKGTRKCTNRDLDPSRMKNLAVDHPYRIHGLFEFLRLLSDLLNEIIQVEILPRLSSSGYPVPEWIKAWRIDLGWLASIPNLIWTLAILLLVHCFI